MISQCLLPFASDFATTQRDPLQELGKLCGIDNLAFDGAGQCRLVFDAFWSVHLFRTCVTSAIALSVEVPGAPFLAFIDDQAHCEIRPVQLVDGTVCVQSLFSESQGSGRELLDAIDRLIHAAQRLGLPTSTARHEGACSRCGAAPQEDWTTAMHAHRLI